MATHSTITAMKIVVDANPLVSRLNEQKKLTLLSRSGPHEEEFYLANIILGRIEKKYGCRCIELIALPSLTIY